MRRFSVLLAIVLTFALIWGVTRVEDKASPQTVYTVTQVQLGIKKQVQMWLNRTVLVRGLVVDATWSLGPRNTTGIQCLPGLQPCSASLPDRRAVHLLLVPDTASTDDVRRLFLLGGVGHRLPSLMVGDYTGTHSALLALLSHVPVLGTLLPPPGPVRWGEPSIYRVRILPRTSQSACSAGQWLCDDAVLLSS